MKRWVSRFCLRLVATMLAKESAMGDLMENETCGSSEKLAQEVMVEVRPVGKARLLHSLFMISNSSIEQEIDLKLDLFDLSQYDISLVQFCVELFSFIEV